MTRPLILTEMITLDGVIEAPGGPDEHPRAGWTFENIEFLPEAYALKGREQEESTALMLGRETFEMFAPVWPSMDDQFARYNAMPKYVVSTTLGADEVEANAWGDCHLLTSMEEVAALKETDGGPIIVHGSSRLAQSLLAANLVDRIHLLTFPVVLGAGQRLFSSEDAGVAKLNVLEDEIFGNGVRATVLEVAREA